MLNLPTQKRRNAISLTPLIDVVFILLLFFMLSSSFIVDRRVDIPLPDTEPFVLSQLRSVSILADTAAVKIEGRDVLITDASALRKIVNEQADAVYLIDVNESVSTQTLITTMDALRAAGAVNVSINGLEI